MGETDLHRKQTSYLIDALDIWYSTQPNIYVSGDNFIYYVEGNPRKCVSPDVYVVFDVPKKTRDCFFTWKERGRLPHVVIEVSSEKTKREDTGSKFELYEQILRVPEYYLFDPTADYIKERLRGYKLQGKGYLNIPLENDRMHSGLLELDLVIEGDFLRLYDPVNHESLPTPAELALRVHELDSRASGADAEIARLRAELERLKQDPQ